MLRNSGKVLRARPSRFLAHASPMQRFESIRPLSIVMASTGEVSFVPRDWETWLATASGPASATEEQDRDRTEARIRRAIEAASDLPSSVRVYAKGSYANGTNVRRDSDVDVAVEWTTTAYVGLTRQTANLTP